MQRAATASDWVLPAAVLAACAPSLLAYNEPPSPTFLNQALALAGWGLFVVAVGGARPRRTAALTPLWTALALVGASVLWSWGPGHLPSTLALSAIGLLAAGAIMAGHGATVRGRADAPRLMRGFCIAWAVAGSMSALLAVVQVFAPGWADGSWIARSGLAGRAVGNLRQPNHLSSLLAWSCVALWALHESAAVGRRATWSLWLAFIGAIVLTASRTGVLSVLTLALWGLLDRRHSPGGRRLLVAAPAVYAGIWLALAAWAHASGHVFGGETRLAVSDLSSSRFGVWRETLALIAAQPWTGVGFGEFNLAWTLTPFPGRPNAFFDHAHNLPLHLLAELGVPLGGAVLVLLAGSLVGILRHPQSGDPWSRAATLFVVLIGLHSLLEYPLWYAYFLLPAAWAWGYAAGSHGPLGPPKPRAQGLARAAGACLVAGGVLSAWDYQRVTVIFSAPDDAAPLEARIDAGRRSVLFGHHADYAAVTTGIGTGRLQEFDRVVHYLIDTRLMIAWSEALARSGRVEHARQLVARLREFGRSESAAFLAPCADAASAAAAFQCGEAGPSIPWRRMLDANGNHAR